MKTACENLTNEIKIGSRVVIIGPCGSGKSTFALELGSVTGLPVIHLDKEYWQPGWAAPVEDEWVEKHHGLVSGERWIIDGNYPGSLDVRLERADTAIFLDYNRYLCLYRVIKRVIKGFGRTRIDMAEGCAEKFDISFLKYVWRFPADVRPIIARRLKETDQLDIFTFKRPKEQNRFAALRNRSG